jgi:hypothetical protein
MEIRIPMEQIQGMLGKLDVSRQITLIENLASGVADTSKTAVPLDLERISEFIATLRALASGKVTDQAKSFGLRVADKQVVICQDAFVTMLDSIRHILW